MAHSDAFLVLYLLQLDNGETHQPRQVVSKSWGSDPVFILAKRPNTNELCSQSPEATNTGCKRLTHASASRYRNGPFGHAFKALATPGGTAKRP